MPAIDFSLKDIKPLLGLIGGGDSKPAAATPAPAPLPPPGPPAPTPAVAGFVPWLQDPATQAKIAEGVTKPGQSIASLATPAPAPGDISSVKPLASAPAPLPTSAPTPAQASATDMRMDMAANPNAYQHNQLMGRSLGTRLAQGGVGALASLASGLKPGGDPTTGLQYVQQLRNHDEGVGAANSATYDLRAVKPLQDAAKLEDTKSQTRQRDAQADKLGAQADDLSPIQITAAQAAAIGHPELAGTAATMRDYNKLLDQAGKNATSEGNNKRTNDTRVTTTGMNNKTKEDVEAERTKRMTAISDAANKTKTLIAQMHDATSRSNNAATNATRGGATSPEGFKVPADVTRRAALASNVIENADEVEKIIQQAPDIIGAAGGRFTNVQQMIGSDDPNIHELGVRMHNIALASNGAHGVRSQGAIQKTEDELFDNFKSGPNGIKGGLKATRGSMQTFLNDENNFATTGRRTGGAPPSTGSPSAPSGSVTVEAPDGSKHTFKDQASANKFKVAAGIK